MKYFLAALAASLCAVAWAQPAQHLGDLRRVLEQYHPASAPPQQARRLTPDERAQLRRQLAESHSSALTKQPPEGPSTR